VGNCNAQPGACSTGRGRCQLIWLLLVDTISLAPIVPTINPNGGQYIVETLAFTSNFPPLSSVLVKRSPTYQVAQMVPLVEGVPRGCCTDAQVLHEPRPPQCLVYTHCGCILERGLLSSLPRQWWLEVRHKISLWDRNAPNPKMESGSAS
jgi:hypothetical protein